MVSHSDVDTIFDYVKWRGDLPFSSLPLTCEDQLVLADLAYVNFSCVMNQEETLTLYDAAIRMLSRSYIVDDYRDRKDYVFLSEIISKVRFSSLCLSDVVNNFDEEMTKQFFALTFHLPDGSLVISYRGTDMSLTGWKEDFNMSFEDTVPSQKDALSYLNRIAAKYKGKIFLTGHSKGGNLAVYATANASKRIQQRIVRVFNNDGPGFNEESRTYSILSSIADKVVTIVPSSSIVGMLLEHLPSYRVIESTSVSIFQHDPYTWCFDGPHFAYKENLSDDSLMMNRILSTWIKSLSREKRETFVDSLFSIFGNAGIKTFRLNSTDVIMRGPDFIRAYFSLAREERKMLKDVTMSLARIAGEMFFDHDEEKGKEKGLLDEKGKKGELH